MRSGIELCTQWTHLWHTLQGYWNLARILLCQEKITEAHIALNQAQEILDRARVTSQQHTQVLQNNRFAWLTERIIAQRASLFLAHYQLEQAQREANEKGTAEAESAEQAFNETPKREQACRENEAPFHRRAR